MVRFLKYIVINVKFLVKVWGIYIQTSFFGEILSIAENKTQPHV